MIFVYIYDLHNIRFVVYLDTSLNANASNYYIYEWLL
jgi:hypothetical protein